MGFDVKISKNALKNSKNDVDKALDYIREANSKGEIELNQD